MLRDFLYSLTQFFGVIGNDDHVPVIFADTKTIIKRLRISVRTFRRRIKMAIDGGFFISIVGKGRRSFYIAQMPGQENAIELAIEKCREHGLIWVIPFLSKNLFGTSNQKNGTSNQSFGTSKKPCPILDTNSFTDLSREGEQKSACAPLLPVPKIHDDIQSINNRLKLNWRPKKVTELVNTLNAYFYDDVCQEFIEKIERLNKSYSPEKVFSMALSDARQWANENGRSSYRPGFVGVHDKYAPRRLAIKRSPVALMASTPKTYTKEEREQMEAECIEIDEQMAVDSRKRILLAKLKAKKDKAKRERKKREEIQEEIDRKRRFANAIKSFSTIGHGVKKKKRPPKPKPKPGFLSGELDKLLNE